MDAEIRRLTYVQRYSGTRPWGGIPEAVQFSGMQLSPPQRGEAGKPLSKVPDVRLETRIIELESERAEIQKKHSDELAAAHLSSAESLKVALLEQQERFETTNAAEISGAIASFREDQKRYFQEAESAVARLALRIAARVLHREVQLDPLLLRGAVRVALEDAQREAGCILEVAASEVEKWRRWLAADALPANVEVRGKEEVPPGHCRLEIGASTADLSVHAQLAEIERGFFDLLQSRSTAAASDWQKNQ